MKLKNRAGFLPTIFDLPEVWACNKKEWGVIANRMAIPLYILIIPTLLLWALLSFIRPSEPN